MAKRAGAKKTAKAKRATRATAQPRTASRTRSNDGASALREALLALIDERGWIDLSLADIAEKAEMPLSEAHRLYSSKAAMLVGVTKAVDERVLAGLDGNPLEGSAKDRLFDLLMRRFDVLKADRSAYRRLIRQLPATPVEFAALLCRLRRSLSLMLEASGLSASGLRGELRLQGLSAVYTAAMRAFVNDESDDLSKTMAEVDKRLGQAERLSDMLNRRRSAA